MILVLGGTSDAREIARALHADGHAVLLSTLTEYGSELAADISPSLPVRNGALDEIGLAALLQKARALVDATHPFATEITRLAIAGCMERGIPYLRFERPATALPPNVHTAADAEEAAALAVQLAKGGVIFLTVGSRTLEKYLLAACPAGSRVVARVLPAQASLAECERLGLPPRDIVAMQGPTSAELDAALLRHFQATVLVTKESGSTGGVLEKLHAAELAGIPAIVVGRPDIDYPQVVESIEDVVTAMKEQSGTVLATKA